MFSQPFQPNAPKQAHRGIGNSRISFIMFLSWALTSLFFDPNATMNWRSSGKLYFFDFLQFNCDGRPFNMNVGNHHSSQKNFYFLCQVFYRQNVRFLEFGSFIRSVIGKQTLMTNVGKCQRISEIVGKCWKMSEIVDRHFNVVIYALIDFPLSENVDQCQLMSTNIGKYWRISENVETYRSTFSVNYDLYFLQGIFRAQTDLKT